MFGAGIGKAFQQLFGMAQDGREQIVEIMRHPAGKLANRLQPRNGGNLGFQPHLFANIAHHHQSRGTKARRGGHHVDIAHFIGVLGQCKAQDMRLTTGQHIGNRARQHTGIVAHHHRFRAHAGAPAGACRGLHGIIAGDDAARGIEQRQRNRQVHQKRADPRAGQPFGIGRWPGGLNGLEVHPVVHGCRGGWFSYNAAPSRDRPRCDTLVPPRSRVCPRPALRCG